MKASSIASLTMAIGVTVGLAGAARGDVTVVDNHETLDVDCAKDPVINLIGNHITVTTTGVCTKISVTGNHETVTGSATAVQVLGNHNTLTLVAADDVSVVGNDNTVTVRKAVRLKAPRIANAGTHNTITRPK